MKAQNYIKNMGERLWKYFDVEKAYSYKEIEFDLFAKSLVRNERYIASKKIAIYGFENHEYHFIKHYQVLKEESISRFLSVLSSAAEELVNPHPEHMSTIITGIIVVEKEISEELRRTIKKFKFMCSFAFGFKGWTYIRLVVVDLSKGEVITNKRGREVKKFYQIP
ncbi:hypothetical protein [Clostridium formicaceticum]|uniref:DUF8052 domain-containing protein n=1 Tax=Clostridium formicaceticum TaxID=1497 RepID=A0AAC9WHT2_9CLOT|nr:hypothetical protein [Clostridium formicaceticum]AOY75011.1 hypothetical protein BJL90_02965 [Clostridium formicaceticum]ARE89427.1 hypothetical protein CLFO_38340 [Clostridium formicaceticum]